MADVIPFRGILFNVPRISQVSGDDVVAPPYDIITPEYQEVLYSKSPYNIVRVDFGKEYENDTEQNNKYSRARNYVDQWLRDKVLIASPEPCFYAYEIRYTIAGKKQCLRGFLGLVKLEELGKGNIYPHECTHSKPKKDRLELLRVCDANVSPIFSLYNSPKRILSPLLENIAAANPYIEAKDPDGAVHRLWPVSDREQIRVIQEELRDKPVFIADGHHRYETALEYRDEMRKRSGKPFGPIPQDYVLMFLANMSEEGLTILPTHRLAKSVPPDAVERLSQYFEIREIPSGPEDIILSIAGKQNCIGFFQGRTGTWYTLEYKGGEMPHIHPAVRTLDVAILHDILKEILNVDQFSYEMDARRTYELVNEGGFEAAFFLNPTRVDDVERVALALMRMPPKSTYFYPKLLTGLVINKFN